jgi:signal transduction histidine kinase
MDSLEQIEMNSLVALKEMRLLLYQLRSLALESGGLQQAIEMRFDLVERRVGIQASCLMDKSLKFSARVEQELFRLVTEALNNALKHARASQVVVIIQSENEAVVLEVQDDGSGFDPGRAYTGMGLQTMQDRASALGGRFEVSSWPAGGTQIRVEIPQLPILAEES